MKVLYIAGYGRSGSTILDIILNNHEKITGVGEITFLLEDWINSSRHCSCGLPYQQCEFWRDLFTNQEMFPKINKLVRKIESRSFILRLIVGFINPEDRQKYREFQKKVFSHILSQSGSSIIVDSSKSARSALGRFVALHKLADQDVYVLHLMRDGFATMESQLVTGDNWALERKKAVNRWPALRTIYGWVITNFLVPLLGRTIGSNRYMLLRYEDFIDNPNASLETMGQFCGFDPSELIDRINRDEYFSIGHLVGGNRVRLQQKVRLKRSTKRKYGSRLKLHQRLLFAIFGGWLQWYYGYR